MILKILNKYPLILQIFKFGLIGTLNFLIDLSIYLLLTRKLSFYYILAHITAFLIANSISFIFNKSFAFQDKENNKIFLKYLKFLSFTIVSLLLSGLVLFITVYYLKMFDIYGKILGTIVAAIWNFLMYKFIVFKTREPKYDIINTN
jgi:putative flippase GtrA